MQVGEEQELWYRRQQAVEHVERWELEEEENSRGEGARKRPEAETVGGGR